MGSGKPHAESTWKTKEVAYISSSQALSTLIGYCELPGDRMMKGGK